MAAPPLLYTAVLTTVPVFAMYKLQAFPLIRNALLWLWLLWLDVAEHQVQQIHTHLFRYYNWTTQPCRIGNRLSVCTGLLPLPAGEPLTVRSRGGGGGGRGAYSARTSNSWSYFRLKNVISCGSLYQESPASKPTKIPRIVEGIISLSKLPSAGRQILLVRLCEMSKFWGCSYNVQQRQSPCKACETAGNYIINFPFYLFPGHLKHDYLI